jgi:hypothetical protein
MFFARLFFWGEFFFATGFFSGFAFAFVSGLVLLFLSGMGVPLKAVISKAVSSDQ